MPAPDPARLTGDFCGYELGQVVVTAGAAQQGQVLVVHAYLGHFPGSAL